MKQKLLCLSNIRMILCIQYVKFVCDSLKTVSGYHDACIVADVFKYLSVLDALKYFRFN